MITITDAKRIQIEGGDFCYLERKSDGKIRISMMDCRGPRELLELASALGDVALDWQNQDVLRAKGSVDINLGGLVKAITPEQP